MMISDEVSYSFHIVSIRPINLKTNLSNINRGGSCGCVPCGCRDTPTQLIFREKKIKNNFFLF